MKVSILLATYNGEKYIREQLDSILNQEYRDFILYISDDGSSDGTWELINDYATKDSRIKLFPNHKPNKSACRHFLFMLEKVQSDLYLFCDQDDVWTSDHIKVFVEKYNSLSETKKSKPVLIHSDLRIVDADLNVISDSFFKYDHLPENPDSHFYFQMNNVTGCVCVVNSCLKEFVFKNTELLKNSLDKILMHDLFFAAIAAEFGKKIFVPKATVLYRQHGTNVCGAGEGWNIKSFIKKCFSYSQHKISYSQHKIFAGFFAEYFKSELSEKEYRCLVSFSNLNKKNKFSRVLFLFNNRFLNLGLVRNLWTIITA